MLYTGGLLNVSGMAYLSQELDANVCLEAVFIIDVILEKVWKVYQIQQKMCLFRQIVLGSLSNSFRNIL